MFTRNRTTTHPDQAVNDDHDPRPRFAIGHVSLPADDVGRLASFYTDIGMRKVARLPGVAIIELRGGTHIAIHKGNPGATTLDLMVDDLGETRDVLAAAGAEPGDIRRQGPHKVFTAHDPEGNTLVVNSSHVAGIV